MLGSGNSYSWVQGKRKTSCPLPPGESPSAAALSSQGPSPSPSSSSAAPATAADPEAHPLSQGAPGDAAPPIAGGGSSSGSAQEGGAPRPTDCSQASAAPGGVAVRVSAVIASINDYAPAFRLPPAPLTPGSVTALTLYRCAALAAGLGTAGDAASALCVRALLAGGRSVLVPPLLSKLLLSPEDTSTPCATCDGSTPAPPFNCGDCVSAACRALADAAWSSPALPAAPLGSTAYDAVVLQVATKLSAFERTRPQGDYQPDKTVGKLLDAAMKELAGNLCCAQTWNLCASEGASLLNQAAEATSCMRALVAAELKGVRALLGETPLPPAFQETEGGDTFFTTRVPLVDSILQSWQAPTTLLSGVRTLCAAVLGHPMGFDYLQLSKHASASSFVTRWCELLQNHSGDSELRRLLLGTLLVLFKRDEALVKAFVASGSMDKLVRDAFQAGSPDSLSLACIAQLLCESSEAAAPSFFTVFIAGIDLRDSEEPCAEFVANAAQAHSRFLPPQFRVEAASYLLIAANKNRATLVDSYEQQGGAATADSRVFSVLAATASALLLQSIDEPGVSAAKERLGDKLPRSTQLSLAARAATSSGVGTHWLCAALANLSSDEDVKAACAAACGLGVWPQVEPSILCALACIREGVAGSPSKESLEDAVLPHLDLVHHKDSLSSHFTGTTAAALLALYAIEKVRCSDKLSVIVTHLFTNPSPESGVLPVLAVLSKLTQPQVCRLGLSSDLAAKIRTRAGRLVSTQHLAIATPAVHNLMQLYTLQPLSRDIPDIDGSSGCWGPYLQTYYECVEDNTTMTGDAEAFAVEAPLFLLNKASLPLADVDKYLRLVVRNYAVYPQVMGDAVGLGLLELVHKRYVAFAAAPAPPVPVLFGGSKDSQSLLVFVGRAFTACMPATCASTFPTLLGLCHDAVTATLKAAATAADQAADAGRGSPALAAQAQALAAKAADQAVSHAQAALTAMACALPAHAKVLGALHQGLLGGCLEVIAQALSTSALHGLGPWQNGLSCVKVMVSLWGQDKMRVAEAALAHVTSAVQAVVNSPTHTLYNETAYIAAIMDTEMQPGTVTPEKADAFLKGTPLNLIPLLFTSLVSGSPKPHAEYLSVILKHVNPYQQDSGLEDVPFKAVALFAASMTAKCYMPESTLSAPGSVLADTAMPSGGSASAFPAASLSSEASRLRDAQLMFRGLAVAFNDLEVQSALASTASFTALLCTAAFDTPFPVLDTDYYIRGLASVLIPLLSNRALISAPGSLPKARVPSLHELARLAYKVLAVSKDKASNTLCALMVRVLCTIEEDDDVIGAAAAALNARLAQPEPLNLSTFTEDYDTSSDMLMDLVYEAAFRFDHSSLRESPLAFTHIIAIAANLLRARHTAALSDFSGKERQKRLIDLTLAEYSGSERVKHFASLRYPESIVHLIDYAAQRVQPTPTPSGPAHFLRVPTLAIQSARDIFVKSGKAPGCTPEEELKLLSQLASLLVLTTRTDLRTQNLLQACAQFFCALPSTGLEAARRVLAPAVQAAADGPLPWCLLPAHLNSLALEDLLLLCLYLATPINPAALPMAAAALSSVLKAKGANSAHQKATELVAHSLELIPRSAEYSPDLIKPLTEALHAFEGMRDLPVYMHLSAALRNHSDGSVFPWPPSSGWPPIPAVVWQHPLKRLASFLADSSVGSDVHNAVFDRILGACQGNEGADARIDGPSLLPPLLSHPSPKAAQCLVALHSKSPSIFDFPEAVPDALLRPRAAVRAVSDELKNMKKYITATAGKGPKGDTAAAEAHLAYATKRLVLAALLCNGLDANLLAASVESPERAASDLCFLAREGSAEVAVIALRLMVQLSSVPYVQWALLAAESGGAQSVFSALSLKTQPAIIAALEDARAALGVSPATSCLPFFSPIYTYQTQGDSHLLVNSSFSAELTALQLHRGALNTPMSSSRILLSLMNQHKLKGNVDAVRALAPQLSKALNDPAEMAVLNGFCCPRLDLSVAHENEVSTMEFAVYSRECRDKQEADTARKVTWRRGVRQVVGGLLEDGLDEGGGGSPCSADLHLVSFEVCAALLPLTGLHDPTFPLDAREDEVCPAFDEHLFESYLHFAVHKMCKAVESDHQRACRAGSLFIAAYTAGCTADVLKARVQNSTVSDKLFALLHQLKEKKQAAAADAALKASLTSALQDLSRIMSSLHMSERLTWEVLDAVNNPEDMQRFLLNPFGMLPPELAFYTLLKASSCVHDPTFTQLVMQDSSAMLPSLLSDTLETALAAMSPDSSLSKEQHGLLLVALECLARMRGSHTGYVPTGRNSDPSQVQQAPGPNPSQVLHDKGVLETVEGLLVWTEGSTKRSKARAAAYQKLAFESACSVLRWLRSPSPVLVQCFAQLAFTTIRRLDSRQPHFEAAIDMLKILNASSAAALPPFWLKNSIQGLVVAADACHSPAYPQLRAFLSSLHSNEVALPLMASDVALASKDELLAFLQPRQTIDVQNAAALRIGRKPHPPPARQPEFLTALLNLAMKRALDASLEPATASALAAPITAVIMGLIFTTPPPAPPGFHAPTPAFSCGSEPHLPVEWLAALGRATAAERSKLGGALEAAVEMCLLICPATTTAQHLTGQDIPSMAERACEILPDSECTLLYQVHVCRMKNASGVSYICKLPRHREYLLATLNALAGNLLPLADFPRKPRALAAARELLLQHVLSCGEMTAAEVGVALAVAKLAPIFVTDAPTVLAFLQATKGLLTDAAFAASLEQVLQTVPVATAAACRALLCAAENTDARRSLVVALQVMEEAIAAPTPVDAAKKELCKRLASAMGQLGAESVFEDLLFIRDETFSLHVKLDHLLKYWVPFRDLEVGERLGSGSPGAYGEIRTGKLLSKPDAPVVFKLLLSGSDAKAMKTAGTAALQEASVLGELVAAGSIADPSVTRGARAWPLLLGISLTPQLQPIIVLPRMDADLSHALVDDGEESTGAHTPSSEERRIRCVLKTCAWAARNLSMLHSLGVVHGDIKPENILCYKSADATPVFESASLADFGCAFRTGSAAPGVPLGGVCPAADNSLLRDELGFGTYHYLAPEQFGAILLGTEPETSAAADVYALGVTLSQLARANSNGPYNLIELSAEAKYATALEFIDSALEPGNKEHVRVWYEGMISGAVKPLLPLQKEVHNATHYAALLAVREGCCQPDASRRWTAKKAADVLWAACAGAADPFAMGMPPPA